MKIGLLLMSSVAIVAAQDSYDDYDGDYGIGGLLDARASAERLKIRQFC